NVRGSQAAGWVATAMQALILVPVVWMCGAALFHWRFNPMLPLAPPGKPFGAVFGAGLALAMWNYAGFEQLSTIAGEMEGGQKTFLRALAWNSVLVTLTDRKSTRLNSSHGSTSYAVFCSTKQNKRKVKK